MNLTRAIGAVFTTKILATVISSLSVIYFARILGAGPLGAFFLFQALLGASHIFANLGVSIGIEKKMSEGDNKSKVLSSGLLIKIILAFFVGALVLFSDSLIIGYTGYNFVIVLAVGIVIKELAHGYIAALRGEHKVEQYGYVNIVSTIFWYSLGVLLVASGYGPVSLAWAAILGELVKLAGSYYLVSTKLTTPQIDETKLLLKFGMNSVIPSVDGYIHSWADVLLIGVFLGPTAVAVYEVAWKVVSPILLLSQAISTSIFPEISSLSVQDPTGRISNVVYKSITFSVILVIPAFFGSLLLAEPILNLFFGSEYVAGATVLSILFIVKYIRAIRLVIGKTVIGLNRPDLVSVACIPEMIFNIVLNILLIQTMGIEGAAIATTVSIFVGTSIRAYYLHSLITWRFPIKNIVWMIGSSSAMFTILWMGVRHVASNQVPQLLLLIITGALIYFLFLIGNKEIREMSVSTISTISSK